MKKMILILLVAFTVMLFASVLPAQEKEMPKTKAMTGEALFKENCSVCHPDGSNIINPKKTLQKKDRDANNVKTAADIVGKMRNPGPGMTKFDTKTLPDKEAKEIAEYVLKTFNK